MTMATTRTPTVRRGAPPMELDLDSFLQTHGGDLFSSSDDDDGHAIRRRTVDEILNDSDSDSDSDSSSPPSPLSQAPILASNFLISTSDPKPEESPAVEEAPDQVREPVSEGAGEPSISFDWRQRSRELSTSLSLSSLGLRSATSSSPSRPLPSLFGSVRPNSKPGAALAAAAAASRSVPTPHAIAIKNRRASSGSVLKDIEGFESAGSEGLDGSEHSEGTLPSEYLDPRDDEGEMLRALSESAEENHSEVDVLESGHYSVSANEIETPRQLEANADILVQSESSQVLPIPDAVVPNVEGNLLFSDDVTVHEDITDSNNEMELEMRLVERDDFSEGKCSDVEERTLRTEVQVENDIDKLVEERLSQLEISRKAEKKAEKKLRASMKPLEWAEELEKRHASSGLHWEEGAVAQPMRLEGIRRGPPAVGYLQIDLDNAITRAISSQQFKRDHGSPQVVAVHMNYIAVGMSRGSVIVVPSKYSAHSADNTDSKMLIFGSHTEKTQAPVTAMCFNQQGDLLLVGYGDGHLTVWDVQKATAAKIIAGEHASPVVHTLFLGQDPQVTRQFKVVTGDSKGLVLLHTVSVVPLLNRITIKTQCLLDGQKTGTVLCACPLLLDDFHGFAPAPTQAYPPISSNGLGSMVGGVVGGVVGGEAGWKLFNEGSPLAEEGVVIFVTNQNALVVRLSPNAEVFDKFPRPDGVREGSMPYAAWKWTSGHDSSLDSSDRVSWLAIAWDRKVQVAKFVKSDMKRYREWNLDSAAIGIAWLDDQMLVILTLRGQLCLFSKDGNELNRTSFVVSGLGLDDVITYNTYFSNTFGNPEKAFHNSIAVRGATIYILGPMHLIVSRLLPWRERIQVLQRAGDWMGSLDMSMRLYDGHVLGVIDLPRTVDTIREVIMSFLVELILSYVDEVFSYISVAFCNQIEKAGLMDGTKSTESSTLQKEIEDQYARVCGVAVEFCVHIKRTDILFDSIFSKFAAVEHGGTFLEILEPYILKDMLGSLPPEIMQALVEHYNRRGWLQRVEQCVLHMDISSLDFNQVVRLCREHGLYGALIYLFNRGLDDYRTPLEELLIVVQDSLRADGASIGYRMLVYLKYCFQGLAFPPGHGSLPSSRVQTVKAELLQFLLEESKFLTSQVSKSFKVSCGICPNLSYLLWLDTEATLEVLRCAFSEEGYSQTDNTTQSTTKANVELNKEDDLMRSRNQNVMVQSIINTLIDILDLESEVIKSFQMEDCAEVWPSKKDLGQLLQFIAFLVSYQQVTISGRVLKHILKYLTSRDGTSDGSNKAEASKKEKQVLTLLKVVSQDNWNSDDVMRLCMDAQFYQACGLIHKIRGQYVNALDSYMKDNNEPVHAFAFVNKILLQLKNNEASFQAAVISRIPELVKLSRECTFFLVIDQFSSQYLQILSELRSHPQSLFLFLKTVIDVHMLGNLKFPVLETVHVSNALSVKNRDAPNDLEEYTERLSTFPKLLQHNVIHITDELTELFLTLLCQFEPKSVLKFLETFDNYRLEQCLRICQEYGVTDAAAFLLERVGDVGNALILMLTGLDEKIDLLVDAVEKNYSELLSINSLGLEQLEYILKMHEVVSVRDVLHTSISLCQRNTRRLDAMESEALWFRVLDVYSEPLKWFCTSKEASAKQNHYIADRENSVESVPKWRRISHNNCSEILRKLFSKFVGELIEGMAGYMPLPVIMAKLLSDNGNQEFGDFKLTIMRMLGTYGYERRILGTAKSLIEDDTYYSLSLLRKGASHAYAPQDFVCCICGCSLTKGSPSGVRIFSCGHSTHLQCEFEENKKDPVVGCPACLPKKNARPQRKSFFVENGLVKNSIPSTQPSEMGLNVQNMYESDISEKPYRLQQTSRFEILSGLQKTEKTLQKDSLPQLRLSPPAIYHEKIQHRTTSLIGEPSDTSLKNEKPNKRWQFKELKSKGALNVFPLRSNIFGPEKNKVR